MATNIGNTPPDYSTPVGQVRVLIGDIEAQPLTPVVPGQGEYMWFSDEAIQGLLDVFNESVKRAAAAAIRTVASSQALLLKKWSADDLSVDGATVARSLRDLASDLDAQAEADEGSIDIFELTTIGGDAECAPELFPLGRYGRCPCGHYGSCGCTL